MKTWHQKPTNMIRGQGFAAHCAIKEAPSSCEADRNLGFRAVAYASSNTRPGSESDLFRSFVSTRRQFEEERMAEVCVRETEMMRGGEGGKEGGRGGEGGGWVGGWVDGWDGGWEGGREGGREGEGEGE